jgi:hypothetical protein
MLLPLPLVVVPDKPRRISRRDAALKEASWAVLTISEQEKEAISGLSGFFHDLNFDQISREDIEANQALLETIDLPQIYSHWVVAEGWLRKITCHFIEFFSRETDRALSSPRSQRRMPGIISATGVQVPR